MSFAHKAIVGLAIEEVPIREQPLPAVPIGLDVLIDVVDCLDATLNPEGFKDALSVRKRLADYSAPAIAQRVQTIARYVRNSNVRASHCHIYLSQGEMTWGNHPHD
jgi:hypothetical protein